jgi:hypothetical protein
VRFWDSSAVVPLVLDERASPPIRDLYRSDAAISVWWATPVECASAIARRERAGALTPADAIIAYGRLERLAQTWLEAEPSEALRRTAVRLVRTHDLRAADALQLAAARVRGEDQPETVPFVTLDDRLALAASREGFTVLGG